MNKIHINWIGLWSFYVKEVQRFLNVGLQTVLAPLVSAFLFFSIFTLAFDGSTRVVGDVSYQAFLAAGLTIMTMMQNAFANSSSSLLHSKLLGNIGDVLMPPLSAWELTLAYLCGGVTRGLMIGIILWLAFQLFVPISLNNTAVALFYGFHGCLFMTSLGLIAAIWAEKFDHMASINNFVVTPLTFLAGTFYSVSRLPAHWQDVVTFNPFYYIIDGFRYGLLTHSEGGMTAGMIVITVSGWGSVWIVWRMLLSGYRLRP